MKTINNRMVEYDVDDLFLNRWSPRAMSSEIVSQNELMSLFEAARWAPSASNNQPWRFVYALRDSEQFQTFYNLLDDGNKAWCIRASALVIVLSKLIRDNGKPIKTHSLDTGAAWENLALQGVKSGLVVHGMVGFDDKLAREKLNLSEHYDVEMMIAIGKPGQVSDLSEKDQARERPSQRKNLNEIVFEEKFHE